MNIDFRNNNINNSISYATSFGSKISDVILSLIIDKDNDKNWLFYFLFISFFNYNDSNWNA